MMRSIQSLAQNGPEQKKPKKVDLFKPHPILAANNAINSFSRNGLFFATNLGQISNRRSVTQLAKDYNINRK